MPTANREPAGARSSDAILSFVGRAGIITAVATELLGALHRRQPMFTTRYPEFVSGYQPARPVIQRAHYDLDLVLGKERDPHVGQNPRVPYV